ncbi:hypothetical protein JL101_015760 [Skermanella rosea]|uniref:hypothetical protein n=1 Tax=Skermanella rosea TaxID=1817965 RepID=UPI0019347559|nr:hypothetical protein [Skermanella rosea]UEM01462.1 hypothetical protein JL101_015760 [Skermanella rosea]
MNSPAATWLTGAWSVGCTGCWGGWRKPWGESIPFACIDGKESVRWLDTMRRTAELSGDPARCVHIGDRKNDIYEFFCLARDLGTHYLVWTCVDRLADDGTASPSGTPPGGSRPRRSSSSTPP